MGICNRRHFLLTICVLQLVSFVNEVNPFDRIFLVIVRHRDTAYRKRAFSAFSQFDGVMVSLPRIWFRDTLSTSRGSPARRCSSCFAETTNQFRANLSSILQPDYRIVLSIHGSRGLSPFRGDLRRNWPNYLLMPLFLLSITFLCSIYRVNHFLFYLFYLRSNRR